MKFLTTIFFATILVVAFSTAGGATTKGLILYFTFDSAKGNIVEDMTGKGHDGTLDLAEIISAPVKFGKGALKIEDENASMIVENFPELAADQDHTYAWWLYFTAGSNDAWSQIIARKSDASDRFPGVWINPGGTGLHYRYNAGNMGFSRIGPDGEDSDFPLNEWFHIACAKEGENLTMYINGLEKGVVAVPAAHDDVTDSIFYIGLTGYRAATFIIDDLVVYNRALTEAESVEIMKGLGTAVSPKGKLAATWASIKY